MRPIKHILIGMIIAILVFSSISCTTIGVKLKTDRFEMTVGQYLDVSEYVDGEFTLSVDGDIASVICGTVIYAESTGNATVTVRKGMSSATVPLYIRYAETELTVSCSSPLYTTVRGSILEFTADLGSNADPKQYIDWYVDNKKVEEGATFKLTLSEYKKYKVEARSWGKTASLTAVCYRPFEIQPQITTDNEVVNAGDEIKFFAILDDTFDFEPEISWYIDGEAVPVAENAEFGELAFATDKAGKHTAWAYVNGIKTNEIEFIVKGVAQPHNVTVDFDSDYPNIYLKWAGPEEAEYEVAIGGATYYSDNDRFSGNMFNLTGLIDLTHSVAVSIKGLSGQYLTESEIVTVNSPIVEERAVQYLSKKYFDGNFYMSSDREVFDIVEYAIMFRPNAMEAGSGEKVTLELYMGYASDMTAAILLSKAWAMTSQMGSYNLAASGSTALGGTPTFEIVFTVGDEPTNFETSGKVTYPTLMTPHFKGGITGFAIDNMPIGGIVTTSDELYYMVQKGYRPQPTSGSAAERIYGKARNVLGKIIADDMSDEEKVRSIFEWIMWNTVYDYRVASSGNPVAVSVKQPAYYLEGVFDTGFAVCDGIAKAMSLMCNMVGIPCIRVVGLAYTNGSPSNHAWNKVLLDGAWYIVDATWSDSRIGIGDVTYEGATHVYYLKADCEMPSHKPSFPELYPKSDSFYNWYGVEREYEGGTASRYIADTSVEMLVAAIKCAAEDVTFTVTLGETTIQRDFYCIEIRLSEKAKNYFRLYKNAVNEAVTGAVRNASWTIVSEANLLLIMVGM